MRGYEVDERDSAWERDDAHYRIYTFEGAGNAVTTVDVEDATVEEALEAAVALSKDNELIWSLALVEDDSRGLRGLIWLSGMDYNDPPDSAREWRRRRQMQERYLTARQLRGEATLLPNSLRLIRIPEWGTTSPLWESFSDEYNLAGPDLGVTPALSTALSDWNLAWQSRDVDDPLPAGWVEQGRELMIRLQSELQGVAEIRPEFLDD